MTPFEIAALSVFGMLVLLLAGVYVGVVLTVVSYVGVWIIKGNPRLQAICCCLRSQTASQAMCLASFRSSC